MFIVDRISRMKRGKKTCQITQTQYVVDVRNKELLTDKSSRCNLHHKSYVVECEVTSLL